MSDPEPDMADLEAALPDVPPHGTHREMVAPQITSRARAIANRIKHRPSWTGDPKDWSTFAFLLRVLFEQVGVQATATNNDARKTSDEPDDAVAWADDNTLVFQLLTEMIDNKTKKGGTMLKQIMKKFPASGGMPGDDLFAFLEEKGTGLTKMQVKALKKELDDMQLLENDSAATWETKLTDLAELWERIPEERRGGDEESLSELMLEKVPVSLQTYATIVEGMSSYDETFMDDSTKVMNKLVDLHRKPTTKKNEGGRAYVSEREQRDRPGAGAFKFTGVCHTCGTKGHMSKDCKRRCKHCGLKCCGGVKGTDKCMVKNGVPPNGNFPPFVVEKVEKRAKEMKKNKGAMIALGEESDGDESDDSSDDGRAFVAKCIVIDEAGVAHIDDGEDEDDETVQVNAYTDSDETSENELAEAAPVGNKCNNDMAANDIETGDINPKLYAKPLKKFVGVPSQIYLGFSSSSDTSDETDEDEESVPEI